MNPSSESLHLEHGVAYHRPAGNVSFSAAVSLISAYLAVCHKSGVTKALINARGLTGFPVPKTFERFYMAVELAAKAASVQVAVVTHAEMIDPERFGVTVALNRGLLTDVFTSEAEAEEWLRSNADRPRDWR